MSLDVDRATFVSLALGMTGVACNSGAGGGPVGAIVVIPAQPPQLADGGAGAPVATGKPAASLPRATSLTAPTAEGDDAEDEPEVSRGPGVCGEDVGTAGSCSVMKACPGFSFPRDHCEDYRRFMKPKVAQRAIDCLAKLSGKDVCDAMRTYKCGDVALRGACADPTVDGDCIRVTTKCNAVSMADCRRYLSGLNAAGRSKVVSCVTSKSGCGFGIYSCTESL